jgi:cyclase
MRQSVTAAGAGSQAEANPAGDATTHRTLIVARLDPADVGRVADLFAASDRTELPRLAAVSRRTLFSFHGLYFHLIESGDPLGPGLRSISSHPLFVDISTKLSAYVRPYDPQWREPKDAMATAFYRWPDDGC